MQSYIMSKRSASDISVASTPPSESESIMHSAPIPISQTASTQPPSATHFIKQTFLGPVCTKCNTKIACRHFLFTISSRTIRRHWDNNKCYEGDIRRLNAKQLERNLTMSIIQLHSSFRNNSTLASSHVSTSFHSISTANSPYCLRCGFVAKLNNLRRHATTYGATCSISDINQRGGRDFFDNYNFCIPQQVLDSISAGTFQLPFQHHPNSIETTNDYNDHDAVSSLSSPSSSSSSSNTSLLITPAKFLPSDEDIEAICSPQTTVEDASQVNSFAMAELLNCFGDEENALAAREYLTAFILLISQKNPGSLRSTLYEIGTMMSGPSTLSPNLNILLQAGKLWLQSDSANMDVRMVPAHHRNAIYLVGNSFSDTDKDLLKGCTFVWSDSIDATLCQFTSLMTYAYESMLPVMQQYMRKVDHVYHLVSTNIISDLEVEEIEESAAVKIVNSKIISGLLCELLLEEPTRPNGPTCIYRYLAGLCVKASTRSQQLSLRSANGISQQANGCLRLLRYGACSFYTRHAAMMTDDMKSDADFQQWASEFIKMMQQCSSVGHICRTIRTAREVDRKTPHSMYKAFNDSTGDVIVDGHEILKSSWSVAIPTACHEWDKHLMLLFPDHSSSSSLPLHLLLQPNQLILAEEDSVVYLGDTSDTAVPLSAFTPHFLQ